MITRRAAIKRVLFSSALLLPGWVERLPAQTVPESGLGEGLHFLAVGDYGSGNAAQAAVAARMAAYANGLKQKAPLAAVLALGDNFYGMLTPERFAPHFEEMYSKDDLGVPFYAIAGNHDYGPDYDSKQGPAKVDIQLDYARANPASRWKMPAKWYSLELPDAANPLVRMVFLDGNFFPGALTPQEKLDQQRFLDAELARPTRAPWTWVVNHFPMFNNGRHGDDLSLVARWGPALASHPVSLFLCGHDHNLQHLEVEGYPCSFVVCGAGGASLYPIAREDRGYSQEILGFTHLHVTPDFMEVAFIDSDGHRLHGFRRTHDGRVEVI